MLKKLAQNGLRVVGIRADDQKMWCRVGRNFSISVFGSLASMAIGIGRTALLTKSLSMDDYGRVLIVLSLFAFLNMFAGIRIQDMLFRFFRRFEQEGNYHSLRALLWLCLGISLAAGLLIGGGVLLGSSWIATGLYGDVDLAPLFRIYAIAVVLSVLGGFSRTILRIYDRFASVVIPQVLGGAVSLTALAICFVAMDEHRLGFVVAAYVVEVVIQTIFPLAQAIRLVRRYLFMHNGRAIFQGLGRHGRELLKVLFHTNIGDYLRLAFEPGDMFLLGIFSSPSQVALYGLARQLTRPLAILRPNARMVVTPEVTSLWAKRQMARLQRLLHRYVAVTSLVGSGVVLAAIAFTRPLVLALSRPEYLDALPIFQLMLLVNWLTLVFIVLYPIGLCMDMLKWYNLVNLANVAILGAVLGTGRLSALKLAYVQLAATLLRRVLVNVWVWIRLRALAGEK